MFQRSFFLGLGVVVGVLFGAPGFELAAQDAFINDTGGISAQLIIGPIDPGRNTGSNGCSDGGRLGDTDYLINEDGSVSERNILAEDESMFFYYGEEALAPLADGETNRIVAEIAELRQYALEQGTELLFMPIPSKETVYYEKVPYREGPGRVRSEPVALRAIVEQARSVGIPTIDLQQAYTLSRVHSDALLFFSDDTHWSPLGVAIAAREAAPRLEALLRQR